MHNRLKLAVAAAALFGSGLLAGQVMAAQPHMTAALGHLQRAETQLERAQPDKGGHRSKALSLIRQAMTEVQNGIVYDRNN
jgi:hypothetical protein